MNDKPILRLEKVGEKLALRHSGESAKGQAFYELPRTAFEIAVEDGELRFKLAIRPHLQSTIFEYGQETARFDCGFFYLDVLTGRDTQSGLTFPFAEIETALGVTPPAMSEAEFFKAIEGMTQEEAADFARTLREKRTVTL